MFRIEFGGVGWGGPRLELTLDEFKDKYDIVEESEGIKIVYNSGIKEYVKDSVIDYSDIWYARGFVIRGAGTSSCG